MGVLGFRSLLRYFVHLSSSSLIWGNTLKTSPNGRIATRIFLTCIVVFGVASCGSSKTSSNNDALPSDGSVKPRTFCETATEASKVTLGMGEGKSDDIKLYYANQVVAATNLAGVAPSDIKEVAENLRISTVELFKIIEKFGFDLSKVEANASAVKQIGDLDTQYKLESSDAAMKKYLLEKCGITGAQQNVPTTVS
jgi:hypothetical protein